ncbi:hypothetical protein KCP75_15535 [Salmonella enterica subsp. enterica]|nr:hypothetical protein KCP75_15535 [Salmonella enterica subsp. enterica]
MLCTLHAFIHWREKYKSAPHTLTVQQHGILAMNYACLWQSRDGGSHFTESKNQKASASTREGIKREMKQVSDYMKTPVKLPLCGRNPKLNTIRYFTLYTGRDFVLATWPTP